LYGAATYLCLTNSDGDVHCSFVIGKSRLSPLRQITIPRLKLSAAVVAKRLDRMVTKEIGIPVDQPIFWTDSSCVLGYITNEVLLPYKKSLHLLNGCTLALKRTQLKMRRMASQLKPC